MYVLLQYKKEVTKDMGLSDIIKAASSDLRSKSSKSEGELTKAMKEMGLDLETGETFMNPPSENKVSKSVSKSSKKTKDQVDGDSVEETSSLASLTQKSDCEDVEENDICYKISNGRMAILIPVDTPLETVELNGINFNQIVTNVPDVTDTHLQVLRVIGTFESKTSAQNIMRVPIFLDKSDDLTSQDDDTPITPELEILREKKHELDLAIATARKNGDSALVNELRKQRRKTRTAINNLIKE